MNVGNQKNHKIKDKQMVLKKLSQFCMIAILCMATLFNFGVNPPSIFAATHELNPEGGQFIVPASEDGITVRYIGEEENVGYLFEVSPEDLWSWSRGSQPINYKGDVDGTSGSQRPKEDFAYPDPGANKFAMMADCNLFRPYTLYKNPELPFGVNTQTTCKFVMNDIPGGYSDNSDEILVKYSSEKIYHNITFLN